MIVHPSLSLQGRRALVTGAGRGLGRAIAVGYAQAGASVVMCARREGLLEETAAQARTFGGEVVPIVADVTEEADVQRLAEAAGPVDILVNNAGTYRSGDWQTVPLSDWDEIIRLNLYAPFRLCQVFAPGMVERRWGRIINVASVYGSMGPKWQLYPESWGPSSYFASKHGIHGITHYLSSRLAPHGVTINSLSPGPIMTSDQRVGLDAAGEERLRKAEGLARSEIQMARLGDEDDYVGPAIFLASPGSRYITGQDLKVDGGWSAW